MRLVADTHIHIYPCYNSKQALDTLRTNLSHLNHGATCAAFLTERADCHFFSELRSKTIAAKDSDLKVQHLDNALYIQEKGHPDLYLFPGRQIVARENIEILALTVDLEIEDRVLTAQEIIDVIRQQGGLPVLSWAPGKWFFKRKKVIEKLLATNAPDTLLLGDTTLRPSCWPTPLLMKKAMHRGFTVIRGSDPLPFAGEEQMLGRYGITIECQLDRDNPAGSVRSFFAQPGLQPPIVGKRKNLLVTLRRLFKNAQSKTDNSGKSQS